ncbi:T9SS type A sorting domain-containing protein [Adhaeribacter soli]|uniref:T9SS type A sorting domain-containing protein n=1 Tax=Adhaeribacter soli TaxID=2607655 RepID=A0A5N1IXG3_9BACT|nr:T9SS type A sorting domain-containing protein [Adhaeribacter soli]KAA9338941.1 T9SS type A sorting domain-containing protein [Adhaeribacter soli]
MKKTFLLLCLSLAGFGGFAQTSRTLSLPFFDDFAKFNNRLDTTLWEDGSSVYVNNQFSRNPVSKNIATFNSFSAAGNLSTVSSTQKTGVDTLTSRPINLSGFSASDSVYLSFYLQLGGIGLVPGTSSYFQVEFLNNLGVWQSASARIFRGSQSADQFTQYFIPITDAKFFHNNFQFRFRSYGESRPRFDTWNLDYVYLNAKRQKNERRVDITTSRPITSLLQRYTAMPIHQFQANIAGELNDSVYTTLNNLEDQQRNITSTTTVQIGNGTPATIAVNPIAIAAFARQYREFPNSPNQSIFANLSGPQDVKTTVTVDTQEPTDSPTLYNDTISGVTPLRDYYAYDDGSPETVINIPRTNPGSLFQMGQKYFLNQNDQVKKLSFYVPKGNNTPGTIVTFRIWNAKPSGEPDGNSIFSQTYTVPPLAQLDTWVDIPVNPPVTVSGSFFAGWTIPSGSATFSTGFDLNHNAPRYFNATNTWLPENNGAVMVRVYMGNHVTGIEESNFAAKKLLLYPNPATSSVTIQGEFDEVKLLTITGQQVLAKNGTGAETQVDVSKLTPGIYLVQIRKKDQVQTQKLIIQPN